MFWLWIAGSVLAVVGLSVWAGKALSKPKGIPNDRHAQMTALKASGALKHRKSNQD
jgi:hypothetical protein